MATWLIGLWPGLGGAVFWLILLPADSLELVPQEKSSILSLDFNPEGRACPWLLHLPGDRSIWLCVQGEALAFLAESRFLTWRPVDRITILT